MKKLLVLVLLVPILALTMISCDAEMRSNFAGWMGDFGGNVYEDAGLIEVNTAQAEAAAATIATIGSASGSEAATTMSFGVTIPDPGSDTKVLSPQTPAKQKELKDNLGDAFNSDAQKAKLLEDLKKPVLAGSDEQKAAQGTVKVLNATLTALKDQLKDGSGGVDTELGIALDRLQLPEIGDTDNLTQGDMLALQLMADLISNTVNTLTEIGSGTLGGASDTAIGDTANRTKVLSIIDDALFAADMAEKISGAASIDFTGQIDLGDLLGSLDDDRGSRSRGEAVSLTDAEDFIGTINAIAPSIVELMGITYNGTEFAYTPAKYRSFLLNQQIYRSSMEQALKMIKLGKLAKKDIDALTFDTSTLIKYALSVFVTEHHAFWIDSGSETPVDDIIVAYLNATEVINDDTFTNKKLGLGTLTKDDVLITPDSLTTGLDYDEWADFLGSKGLPYIQAIVGNIIQINDLGGIAQLSTMIKEDFYDPENPSDDDGLSEWLGSL